MGGEFNGAIYFILWGFNMAAKQEVPSITTDSAANQLFLCLCRFRYVKNPMAPFIL